MCIKDHTILPFEGVSPILRIFLSSAMLSDAISVHLEPVHNENDANQNDTFGSKKWGGPCPPGPPGSDGPVCGRRCGCACACVHLCYVHICPRVDRVFPHFYTFTHLLLRLLLSQLLPSQMYEQIKNNNSTGSKLAFHSILLNFD